MTLVYATWIYVNPLLEVHLSKPLAIFIIINNPAHGIFMISTKVHILCSFPKASLFYRRLGFCEWQ